MNKKIAAFTLQELIVVLIITTLVMSITMVVLNLVQQQILKITKNYQVAREVRLFERVISNDMEVYQFTIAEQTDKLVGVSENGTVSYSFEENLVLRDNDTIFVQVKEATCLFENVEVFSGEIDAIDVLVNDKNIFLRNRKTAANYMEKLWLLK